MDKEGLSAEDILDRIEQINSLVLSLGKYFQANPNSRNEVLVILAVDLSARSRALTYVLRCSDFREVEVNQIIENLRHIQSSSEDIAFLERIKPLLQSIFPDKRNKHRLSYAQSLMVSLNGLYDLGRVLLKARDLEETGMSQTEIEAFINSWKRPNLF
jgi:hypothetical protein